MQPRLKIVSVLLAASLVFCGVLDAAPSSRPGSSSKSSTSSTPSSRPSSRPSSGPSTKPSTPSSRPNSVAPSAPSSRPSISINPNTSTKSSSPSTRPSSITPNTSTFGNSSKPSKTFSGGFDSGASNAKKREESNTIFQAAQKPKDAYITPQGKTVKIDTSKPSVTAIRNSTTPEEYTSRPTRVEHHYHTHYGSRYDTYRSRPYIDVGGGYSPLFWYVLLDWNVQRQAQWMYHNQNTLNQAIYQEQLAKNAALRAEIERLKATSTPINPNYVDPEFQDNPDLMYSDEYVNAVYNPTPTPVSQSRPMTAEEQAAFNASVGTFFKWVGIILLVCVGGCFAYYLVFVKNWG